MSEAVAPVVPASRSDDRSRPKRTPLHDLHVELGGKMVDFAGWTLPVHYPGGIMAEHRHCRAKAGLFDVSHMGQVLVRGDAAATAFERLVPGDIQALSENHARYTLFTNDQGGVLDDLIVSRIEGGLFVVVNAACRAADIAHMRAFLEPEHRVEELTDRALLALQGPKAAEVLRDLVPAATALRFLETGRFTVDGMACRISRLGYTGEDGFEISIANDLAVRLARLLLASDQVEAIGLGARDSLRLEAGLCLYGHELSTEITPIEANLAWTIGKRRRLAGDFPGADVILAQLTDGPARKLVGLRPTGRAPARENTEISDLSDHVVGRVTSGGFGPTVNGPVSMGYVRADRAAAGTPVKLRIRGKAHDAEVIDLPFVAHRFHR